MNFRALRIIISVKFIGFIYRFSYGAQTDGIIYNRAKPLDIPFERDSYFFGIFSYLLAAVRSEYEKLNFNTKEKNVVVK